MPTYQIQGGSKARRRKGSRARGWNVLAVLLGAFMVCFFLTNLLLYERLGDAMAHAKGDALLMGGPFLLLGIISSKTHHHTPCDRHRQQLYPPSEMMCRCR